MWRLRLKRFAQRNNPDAKPLLDCWREKIPGGSIDWRRVEFLVCDAEMSSLEVTDGELLSLGWVIVNDGAVKLDTAEHHLINAEASVGQSATIHQLRDCELSDAEPLSDVLTRFIEAAAGRILVFHNATLDMAFLNHATRTLYNSPALLPIVDTMQLEEQLMRRRDQPIRSGDLRLQGCRDRYSLPAYPVHNALLDAIATAELLVAHARRREGNQRLSLAELM